MKEMVCMICGHRAHKYVRKENFIYYQCSHCGLLFLAPLPSVHELARFYNRDYFEAPSKDHNAYKCGYDDYADSIRFKESFNFFLLKTIILRDAKTVLDVGAAYGSFVKFLNDHGLRAQGIEISSFAVAKAQNLGIDVVESSIEVFAHKNTEHNQFDMICLLDVFEHLYNYEHALNGMRLLLKDNGYLLIVTPSSRSMPARLLGKRWYHFLPPQHLHLFNEHNIKTLLQKYGYRVVQSEYIYKTFSVKYFLHIFSGWTHIPIPQFINAWFGNVTFKFPLRDNIMVIAQKQNE